MSLQITAFEPLLRVSFKPTLSRYCPDTKFKTLKTRLLSETLLVQGVNATFDDTCFVTVPAEGHIPWVQIKLVVHGTRKAFTQVHLGLFGNPQGLT